VVPGAPRTVTVFDSGESSVDSTARVVIPSVRRPFGEHTGRAGGLVHYALYEPGGVL
jgi:hypothetical protein